MISDAGTPIISDPGLILVKNCISENLNVSPIPGASAVTAAVTASGFSDQYLFYGFLSKKESEVDKVLKNLNNLDFTIVFFIPASKINFYISKFKSYFQDRKILLAKEMTKVHEKFIRNDVSKISSLPEKEKGEFTVVLSEIIKLKNIQKEINESVKVDIKKMLKKYSHKDVVEFISKKENLSKKTIYEYCLKFKNYYEKFAVKFALKEALIKSINKKIFFSEIETSYSNSKPIVKILNSKENYKFLVSLSHENEIAVAVIISEKIM